MATFCPDKTPPQDWDWQALQEDYVGLFNFQPELPEVERNLSPEGLENSLLEQARQRFDEKEEDFSESVMEQMLKYLLLQAIDSQWKDHLLSIDHLKEGIGLRGYGQKNPKEEYKREAYGLFMEMMGRIRQEVVNKLYRVQLVREEDVERLEEERRRSQVNLNQVGGESEAAQGKKPVMREDDKVGRNDPCPCGSGKKFKKCCGS